MIANRIHWSLIRPARRKGKPNTPETMGAIAELSYEPFWSYEFSKSGAKRDV
jgi:hypothetical protein